MRTTAVFAAFLFLLGTAPQALAQSTHPTRWRKGQSEVSIGSSFFTSKANYTERGTYENLPGDNSFENWDLDLKLRHNFSRRFGASLGTTLSKSTSRDSTLTRDNSEISQITAALSYAVLRKRTYALVTELEGAYTLDPISPNTINVLTSDGVHYIYPRVFGYKTFSKFYIGGLLGLKVRDEGLSGLLTYSVQAGRRFGKLDLAAAIGGFESIIDDELTLGRRAQVTDRVNAHSFYFYSYNPALLHATVSADWRTSPDFIIGLYARQTIDGEQTAAGTMVGMQAKYSFDFGFGSRRRTGSKEPEGFEVQTNEADPELFEDDND